VSVRVRTPWEAQAISAAITAVVIVVAVCLCILSVAALLFAIAQLKAHWP